MLVVFIYLYFNSEVKTQWHQCNWCGIVFHLVTYGCIHFYIRHSLDSLTSSQLEGEHCQEWNTVWNHGKCSVYCALRAEEFLLLNRRQNMLSLPKFSFK
jgi:hypothetical protein